MPQPGPRWPLPALRSTLPRGHLLPPGLQPLELRRLVLRLRRRPPPLPPVLFLLLPPRLVRRRVHVRRHRPAGWGRSTCCPEAER